MNNQHPIEPQQHLRTILGRRQDGRLSINEILQCTWLSIKVLLKKISSKFSAERLIPHDYVITATSRVTNVWAFVVTLLVIAIAVGSFIYRRKNK